MFRVRHYNDMIHPDTFRNGGWLGFVIRCLNWARWKLETFIQGLVIRFLARQGKLEASKVSALMRTFRLDVKAEELQKEQTSPLHEQTEVPQAPQRAERYMDARAPKVLEREVAESSRQAPMRPESLNNLIGKYAFNHRARRHAHGRRFTFGAPEGEFEPVETGGSDGG